nr:hypothetical protein CFP56_11032 [Quercus suber]
MVTGVYSTVHSMDVRIQRGRVMLAKQRLIHLVPYGRPSVDRARGMARPVYAMSYGPGSHAGSPPVSQRSRSAERALHASPCIKREFVIMILLLGLRVRRASPCMEFAPTLAFVVPRTRLTAHGPTVASAAWDGRHWHLGASAPSLSQMDGGLAGARGRGLPRRGVEPLQIQPPPTSSSGSQLAVREGQSQIIAQCAAGDRAREPERLASHKGRASRSFPTLVSSRDT